MFLKRNLDPLDVYLRLEFKKKKDFFFHWIIMIKKIRVQLYTRTELHAVLSQFLMSFTLINSFNLKDFTAINGLGLGWGILLCHDDLSGPRHLPQFDFTTCVYCQTTVLYQNFIFSLFNLCIETNN